jgi:Cys-Gly metallodipeptidase DUG1
MADYLDAQLKNAGAQVTQVPLGKQVLDGQEVQLPPAILAQIGNDPKKRTILIYGHFDVQPVCRLLALFFLGLRKAERLS